MTNINKNVPKVIWFTGLSGSGKSSIADELKKFLLKKELKVYSLDGDVLRNGLCKDLKFTKKDRDENIRRAGEVAKLFFDQGYTVLASFISPYRAVRNEVKLIFPKDSFVEVYVKADIETCIKRDVKGLYKKAINGEIENFTGISDVYEEPDNPQIMLDTDISNIAECAEKLLNYLNLD